MCEFPTSKEAEKANLQAHFNLESRKGEKTPDDNKSQMCFKTPVVIHHDARGRHGIGLESAVGANVLNLSI